MQKFFITATNTDVGKSYSIVKMINFFKKEGFRVLAIKPFESGVVDKPLDGSLILETLNDKNLTIDDIVYYKLKLPAAIYVANKIENIPINIDNIKTKIEQIELEGNYDVLLIEGAGGLLVPIELDFYIIDLIKLLEAKAILICDSKLGSINDTLLSIEALKSREIDFEFVINLFRDRDSFEKITYPFYKNKFEKVNFLENEQDLRNIFKELF